MTPSPTASRTFTDLVAGQIELLAQGERTPKQVTRSLIDGCRRELHDLEIRSVVAEVRRFIDRREPIERARLDQIAAELGTTAAV